MKNKEKTSSLLNKNRVYINKNIRWLVFVY